MFDTDKWQEIYSTLSKNKLRTFLTAFGVFWGIFMLILMLGAGNGLQNGVRLGMENWAGNTVYIWSQQTTKQYKGFTPGRQCEMTNADIAAIRNKIPEVDIISPRHRLGDFWGSNEVKRGNKSAKLGVMGDYPEYTSIEFYQLEKGRFINQIDIKEKRKVIVLRKRALELLFDKNEDPIGKYVQVNESNFKVIGVLKTEARNGEWQKDHVYIPFTTFQYTFNYGDKVGWFGMTAHSGVPASLVQEKVLKLLKERHHVHPDDNQAYGSENLEKEFGKINGLFLWIKIISWFVGAFTLLAGVIGVSNIMLIILRERTKEIGIRRAIGATPWAIVSQILMESVALTSIAGYFGLLAGIGLLEVVAVQMRKSGAGSDQMFAEPGVNLWVGVIALIILVFSGLAAGFIPARRALSIHPVEALRAD